MRFEVLLPTFTWAEWRNQLENSESIIEIRSMRVFAVYAHVYLYSNLLLTLTGHCNYGLVSTKTPEFCLRKAVCFL
jgi:hypothetical protein